MVQLEASRPMAVAGLFYPKSCTRLKLLLASLRIKSKTDLKRKPKALVVPHAGYVYSGVVGAKAYAIASRFRYNRIVVIGPSHRIAYDGISGSFFEYFDTPCKKIPIDTPYLMQLAKEFPIGFVPNVHTKEHSTEVQMPLIAHFFKKVHVVELIYGHLSLKSLASLVRYLLQDSETLCVISTDLSHYYPLQKAQSIDTHCIKAFKSLTLEPINRCEACGWLGLSALIKAASDLKLQSRLLAYSTGTAYSGVTSRVVGYMSGVVC